MGRPLVFLIALLALLLASFPARNSDLWMHLAGGRWLLHGQPAFGPTWLYDVTCYGLYAAFGGVGLVLAKALVVAGVALVLLALGRRGRAWWLAAACTALALLTMSTRLLLEPATVSLLFLALALWFIRGETGKEESGSPPARPADRMLPPVSLLLLFVVWANVDRSCVVGLAVVALESLGEALDALRAGSPARLAARRLVPVAVLAAACLLNPALAGLFLPSAQFGWLGRASAWEPGASPFGRAYLARLAHSPGGLAYFPLLALGLLSFGLNRGRWSWGRFLPWAALAVGSALQTRVVPFFAVVAGPVLAWNVHDALAARLAAGRRSGPAWPELLTLGRVLTGLLALALLVCAWPGWLQGPPLEPRRWAVETSPSLERGAAQLARWHRDGKLGPEAHGLFLSPEAADAFAWFCPGEKGVLDEPLAAAIRGEAEPPPDWRPRLRARGINHLILYVPDRGRLFAALQQLLAQPEEWPLLSLEGDLAVFGWRDPAAAGAGDPFRGLELDLNRLAFHPGPDGRAPRQRPVREAAARPWWEAFWKPAPPRPIDRDEATLHLFHAEALRRDAPRRLLTAWEAGECAALVAAAPGGAGPGALADTALRLDLFQPQVPAPGSGPESLPALDRLVLRFQQRYTLQHDDIPPALLFLGVRAARRAVAADPGEAQAYLVLGECYVRLLRGTRERTWAERLPRLAALRQAQASAALYHALALKPDLAQAHLSLAGVYSETGCLDLALDHLRRYQQLVHKAGPPAGVRAEAFREEEAAFQEKVDRVAQDVQGRTDAWEVASAKDRVLDRAQAATRAGLGGKALDILLASDRAAFGIQGMGLELELLLKTGRAGDVRDWLSPADRAALGASAYHWFLARALAATGDYALAEEECNHIGRPEVPGAAGPQLSWRHVMALLVSQAVLEEHIDHESVPSLIRRAVHRLDYNSQMSSVAASMRQEADAGVLRGLLALEEGDAEEAEAAFRVVLATWGDEAEAASGGGLDFGGRPVAQGYLALLE